MIASDFLVLPMRLTEAIIVYGREDKQRNLKIVRSKEFRPNFRAAEQNVGRIWPPQPKCSKVGKVHLHGSQVRCPGAGRCALHYPTPSYTLTLPCKPGCSRRILQAQALAQKWLKLESNVFIALTHCSSVYAEKLNTLNDKWLHTKCPEIFTHKKYSKLFLFDKHRKRQNAKWLHAVHVNIPKLKWKKNTLSKWDCLVLLNPGYCLCVYKSIPTSPPLAILISSQRFVPDQ